MRGTRANSWSETGSAEWSPANVLPFIAPIEISLHTWHTATHNILSMNILNPSTEAERLQRRDSRLSGPSLNLFLFALVPSELRSVLFRLCFLGSGADRHVLRLQQMV